MNAWWQNGLIYEIYPRSFQDSNGDGVGDLNGISERIGYCADLGVDAVWLSPIYPSPMADFGYDVSNYVNVDPLFGSLADFDRLLREIKRRGLKLILDFVPNHTSDQHPWFQASRRSRADPQRDWYLWRDAAADGGPPNNWLSNFGGSAWTWDAASQQYYYHSFLSQQPDLNWRHPAVVAAMHEAMRFWLRRGVDGFRIDVLWLLVKDAQWRDNPPNPAYRAGMPAFASQLPLYTSDGPETQTVIEGLRRVSDEFEGRILIGEIYLPVERLVRYYGTGLRGVQMPFNFQLLLLDWNARAISVAIDRYESLLPTGAWPNWVLGNHDRPRLASRIGAAQVRVAAMLLLTLRGTPTLYYGDEIGMSNGVIPRERVQDQLEKNVPGAGLGRDPCRTPMQWNPSPRAGFSTGEPWLPVGNDQTSVNVESESNDPSSLLSLYRRLIALRRAHRALTEGDYAPIVAADDVLAFIRHTTDERVLVVLNLAHGPQRLDLPEDIRCSAILLSTDPVPSDAAPAGQVHLRADEGIILALKPEAKRSA
ncbi:MAG TPA: alpha-amylase family glycosyl hydrolase [Steroidobacteraceae bacterium]|nr:alpha-amylase family glycosyl hydrolase [Steroidobacteraceae bacterium]